MFVLKTNEVVSGNITISYKPANLPALTTPNSRYLARFPMVVTRRVYTEGGTVMDCDEVIVYLHDDELAELYKNPMGVWHKHIANWGK